MDDERIRRRAEYAPKVKSRLEAEMPSGVTFAVSPELAPFAKFPDEIMTKC